MTNYFSTLSEKKIRNMPFEKLKEERRSSMSLLMGILFAAGLLSITAIWMEWPGYLQSILLLVMLLSLPKIITTTRMSKIYHERKKS